jgi:hypothetical protein
MICESFWKKTKYAKYNQGFAQMWDYPPRRHGYGPRVSEKDA